MCVLGLSIDDLSPNDSEEGGNFYIQFENHKDSDGHDNAFLKKLESFLEKPTKEWKTPSKLSSHLSSCKNCLVLFNAMIY